MRLAEIRDLNDIPNRYTVWSNTVVSWLLRKIYSVSDVACEERGEDCHEAGALEMVAERILVVGRCS